MNDKTTEPVQENLPEIVKKCPELLPLWDWWVKDGRSTVVWLLVAAAIVGGVYAWRNWRASRTAAAAEALTSAFAADELEAAVANYGSSSTGEALKLRLAKSYFDTERYDEALKVYDELIGKATEHGPFSDIAVIGRAYALEALGQYDEANKVFADFAADEVNAKSYLKLTADLGAARTIALKGDREGAINAIEALEKTVKSDDFAAKARIERMLDCVKRFDPNRKQRSLFDAADAAEKAVAAEAKTDDKAAKIEANADIGKASVKAAPVNTEDRAVKADAKADAKDKAAATQPEAKK